MIIVVDAVREVKPPFSPEAVVADFAVLLHTYNVTAIIGDRWGGEWPREAFAKHGIVYEIAAKPKSDVYRDVLPLLNSGRVEPLDHPRLVAQFAALERRTARGGRDSIDHAPHSHDDLANAVALAILVAHATATTPIDTGPTGEELDSLRAWSRANGFSFSDPNLAGDDDDTYPRFYL